MTARGIRNNNPGNIRKGAIEWEGLSENQTDPAFCVFDDMRFGVRALIKVLRTYYFKYHLGTIREIIGRWAPPEENDTEAYARAVCTYCRRTMDEELPLDKHDMLFVMLAEAICCHENGIKKDALYETIPSRVFREGGRMAGLKI